MKSFDFTIANFSCVIVNFIKLLHFLFKLFLSFLDLMYKRSTFNLTYLLYLFSCDYLYLNVLIFNIFYNTKNCAQWGSKMWTSPVFQGLKLVQTLNDLLFCPTFEY